MFCFNPSFPSHAPLVPTVLTVFLFHPPSSFNSNDQQPALAFRLTQYAFGIGAVSSETKIAVSTWRRHFVRRYVSVSVYVSVSLSLSFHGCISVFLAVSASLSLAGLSVSVCLSACVSLLVLSLSLCLFLSNKAVLRVQAAAVAAQAVRNGDPAGPPRGASSQQRTL